MTIRSTALLAAALFSGAASPAAAQYDPHEPPPLPEEAWHDEWHARPYDAPPLPYEAAPPRAYPADQRAAWLEACRRVYYDDRGERRGEAIGAVLGGVAGAIAGNRIADGARLGGTILGGGVGALAGSAIGGAVGEASDRERYADRVDECEAYLASYERGYAPGYSYGMPGYGYPGPVLWVKVPIVRHRHGAGCGCERIVERVMEEPRARPAERVPDKRVRIAPPAADKRLRSTK